jgi:hypothetical protein
MGGETKAPLQFTDRERIQIEACRAYAAQWEVSGLPGHGLFILVAKIAAHLEDAVTRFGYAPDADPPIKVQKVAWDGPRDGSGNGCWRDLMTGVRVEL